MLIIPQLFTYKIVKSKSVFDAWITKYNILFKQLPVYIKYSMHT